jgi:hypothetical protein
MASRSKQKTTMAKLNRERALQERRLRKQLKKDARRQAAADRPDANRGPDVSPLDDGPPDVVTV